MRVAGELFGVLLYHGNLIVKQIWNDINNTMLDLE